MVTLNVFSHVFFLLWRRILWCQQFKCSRRREDRIYLTSDQIIISDKEIIASIDGTLYALPILMSDEGGIYVPSFFVGRYGYCRNGHSLVCPKCWGCGNSTCVYKCMGHSWGFK